MTRVLNYKFQKGDKRDYKISVQVFSTFPPQWDARDKYKDLPVYDQGTVGACTANATALAYIMHLSKQGNKTFLPSRLYIYANSRLLVGTPVSEDSGADLRDVMRAVDKYDTCPEDVWSYEERNYFRKPTKDCYAAAKKHAVFQYLSVPQGLKSMKQALYDGAAIIFGIMIYESFMSEEVARSGVVPMPDTSKEECLGGHAITMVGWDDSKNAMLCQNSWGKEWGCKEAGDQGCFWLPYEYVLNRDIANDFWVIEAVS